ncbi:EAL domain-containing protein [Metabacillus sp. GX 13764]|uniref:sensor domain-containing protein n=1 Tax=Metabacillus kandeliae TaxID=2900151 RepID=UPI001E2D8428|nr:GGDEF and EAL domain-containing protein [Metabacillus kandeliae]MCD7034059.1 EAL domain-containing protein [Metabacillus kandeliae]
MGIFRGVLTQKKKFISIMSIIVLAELTGSILFSANFAADLILDLLLCLLVVFLCFGVFNKRKKSDELQQSEQRLKHVFDALDVAIWSHDLVNDTLWMNPGIEKLYGYPLKAFYRNKALWKDVIYSEDLPLLEERAAHLQKGEPFTSQYRIVRPDGEIRWIMDRGVPTLDPKGDLIDFNSVLFDITDRKESEERYRSLVEMSPDFIAVCSRDRIDYINEAGRRLFGGDLIGKPAAALLPEALLLKMKETEGKSQFEYEAVRSDGTAITAEMASMPIHYEGREARQIVGRDISERKETERMIHHMAYFDALTGLPNRNMFRKRVGEALKSRSEQKLAVLFLDLDRFKMINDTKGHTAGDSILKIVAEKLVKAAGAEGMVSRHSGDEFIILLENAEREQAAQTAQRIIEELSSPIEVNSQPFFITASIGISTYPYDGFDEEMLTKQADTAMYQAKEKGKNNYQFYSAKLQGQSLRKMELENGLRKAMEDEELVLYYQPQVDLETGSLTGAEALIRWHGPDGFIQPLEFIPLAEETGLIVPLGKWILERACTEAVIWKKNTGKDVPVAVNISARQFLEDDFAESVMDILELTGLQPSNLELEITESIMQDIDRSSKILKKLKETGVKIAIDDFGTGYSSLSCLKYLPIDRIKIDKSFVDDITSTSRGAMVKTIIDMGSNLDFDVIAEGIESEEQAVFLREHSCLTGQGYLYGKPEPAEELMKKLKEPVLLS